MATGEEAMITNGIIFGNDSNATTRIQLTDLRGEDGKGPVFLSIHTNDVAAAHVEMDGEEAYRLASFLGDHFGT